MTKPTDITDFDRVDDSENTEKFVDFLDTVSGLERIKERRRRTFELLAAKPGQRILEVGCGTGEDARTLGAMVAPGGKVVALDKSEEMIAEAEKRSAGANLPLEFVLGDAMDLDFDAESFDGCWIDRTLVHVPDPVRAVREMVRVLRSGGRFVAFEADVESFVVDSPHRELTRRILRFWCDNFQSAWIARHLPALFRECGILQVFVEPRAMVWDFDFANQVLISGNLERAVEAGIVTSAEADLWLSHLENARDSGNFLCANMGFIVAGQKE
jgi:ubiquinone/menaquinone biosynthesis C-methylase UbiE